MVIVWVIMALLLVALVITNACWSKICKKLADDFDELAQHTDRLYGENIKLQHKIYKMSFLVPKTDDESGKVEKNGRK